MSSNISSAMFFSVRHGNISTVTNLIDKYGFSCEEWSAGYNLLLEALKYRRSAVAKLLLSKGARVNAENSNISDPTPLHVAIENNEKEMIEMLLEKGAAINVRGGKRKCTPLHEAVYHNKIEIAELLLKNEALVDVPNSEDETPLRAAVDRGHVELVKVLLQNAANVNSVGDYSKHSGFTPLHIAATKGCKDIVELLLGGGAEVNGESCDSRTPLHIAVEKGFIEVAEALLNRNANVNAQTADSLTPLHIAVERSNKELVKLLLKMGASVNVKEAKYFTPLHLAVGGGHSDVIEMLLNTGANINASAEDSLTPLHMAVELGSEDIVELLLSHNADINAACTDFRTPLHVALENDNFDIAKLLLKCGANANTELEDRQTLLHIAARNNSIDFVTLLLNNGADVNAKTIDSVTPLHISIRTNCKDLVQLFLERGADVNAEDQNSYTPLCLAVETGCPIIFDHVLKFHPDVTYSSNQNALSIAVCKGGDKERTIKRLLEYGFPVKPEDAKNSDIVSCVIRNGFVKTADEIFKYGTSTTLEFNLMPLHLAIIYRQTETAKVLLMRGANVNAEDSVGRTPIYFATANADFVMFEVLLTHNAVVKDPNVLLHLAAKSGCLEIVKAVLDWGCDIESQDGRGRTALHDTNFSLEPLRTTPYFPRYLKSLRVTAWEVDAHMQIADYLLINGANVNARDRYGETPLHIAARESLVEIAKVLLKHGADVNLVDKYGDSALDSSVRSGNLSLTRILLNEGAKVNTNLGGKPTPLHLATRSGNTELVKLLLEWGADVDAVRKDGAAIHIAVRTKPDLQLVKLLLEYCADVNAQCEQGTALHLAAEYGLIDVVRTLLEYGSDINIKNKNGATPLECAQTGSSNDSSYVDDCPFSGTFGFLLEHLVRMAASGSYVNAQNLRYLETDSLLKCFGRDSKWPSILTGHLSKCEKEIQIMKDTKIGDSNISFYDILTRSAQPLVRILGNNSIVQGLNVGIYRDIFPIYASTIWSKLKVGKIRRKLDEECRRVFFAYYVPGLPDICIDLIFTYLTNGDLKKLIRVCHPTCPLFEKLEDDCG